MSDYLRKITIGSLRACCDSLLAPENFSDLTEHDHAELNRLYEAVRQVVARASGQRGRSEHASLVVVERWFADGSGRTFHAKLELQQGAKLEAAITHCANRARGRKSARTTAFGGAIVVSVKEGPSK